MRSRSSELSRSSSRRIPLESVHTINVCSTTAYDQPRFTRRHRKFHLPHFDFGEYTHQTGMAFAAAATFADVTAGVRLPHVADAILCKTNRSIGALHRRSILRAEPVSEETSVAKALESFGGSSTTWLSTWLSSSDTGWASWGATLPACGRPTQPPRYRSVDVPCSFITFLRAPNRVMGVLTNIRSNARADGVLTSVGASPSLLK
jgi:hypothetical protein